MHSHILLAKAWKWLEIADRLQRDGKLLTSQLFLERACDLELIAMGHSYRFRPDSKSIASTILCNESVFLPGMTVVEAAHNDIVSSTDSTVEVQHNEIHVG